MKEKKIGGRKLIINSIVYSFSGLLLKCFSFFLIPLYTTYLSTEDYGITSIATSFLSTMGYIVAFSLFSAIMRFYVDLKDDAEKLKRFYGTIITFVFISSFVFAGILIAFNRLVSTYVFAGIDFYPIVLISVVTIAFSCQHTVYDNILKSQQKAAKSSILSIVYFFVTLFLNVMFVVVLRKGALGVVMATLISSFLYTLYAIIDMLRTKSMVICIDFKILKDALKYSIPIMPHNLSTQIASLFSKSFIGGVSTLSALGIYAIASQFGNLSDTIQHYVNQAYGPWLYEKLHDKNDDYKNTLRDMVRMLTSVIGLFLIGIAIFAQDYIVLFVDNAYVDSWRYVPFVVLVFGIKTAYYFYVNILFYYKKASKLLFVSTLSSSFLNILLSALLIPNYGVYGSILADSISMLLRVAIIIIISKHFDDIGLKIRDFVFNFVIVAAFIFLGLAMSIFKYQNVFNIWNFLYKILIIIIYVSLIFVMHKKQLIPLLNRFLKRKKHESEIENETKKNDC